MQLGMAGLGRMGSNIGAERGCCMTEEAVPAEVLSAALYARFRSRAAHSFANRLPSAMRFQLGGHTEKKK